MPDNWREVTAEWQGEMGFMGSNPAGGRTQMGTVAGQAGVSPMDMLLLGMAGCTGVDIVSILNKKRKNLSAFKVNVRGKRADEHPKVYTEIEVEYLLWGDDLDEKSVEQAIQLSEDKYCSASAMLGAVARISSSYRIFAPQESGEK